MIVGLTYQHASVFSYQCYLAGFNISGSHITRFTFSELFNNTLTLFCSSMAS